MSAALCALLQGRRDRRLVDRHARMVEVPCSHVGFLFCPEGYRAVADALSTPTGGPPA